MALAPAPQEYPHLHALKHTQIHTFLCTFMYLFLFWLICFKMRRLNPCLSWPGRQLAWPFPFPPIHAALCSVNFLGVLLPVTTAATATATRTATATASATATATAPFVAFVFTAFTVCVRVWGCVGVSVHCAGVCLCFAGRFLALILI